MCVCTIGIDLYILQVTCGNQLYTSRQSESWLTTSQSRYEKRAMEPNGPTPDYIKITKVPEKLDYIKITNIPEKITNVSEKPDYRKIANISEKITNVSEKPDYRKIANVPEKPDYRKIACVFLICSLVYLVIYVKLYDRMKVVSYHLGEVHEEIKFVEKELLKLNSSLVHGQYRNAEYEYWKLLNKIKTIQERKIHNKELLGQSRK